MTWLPAEPARPRPTGNSRPTNRLVDPLSGGLALTGQARPRLRPTGNSRSTNRLVGPLFGGLALAGQAWPRLRSSGNSRSTNRLVGPLSGRLARAGVVGVVGVVGLVSAVGLVWRLRRRLLIVTITGASMLPTYGEGDRVLVRRDHVVRAGDVVVADVGPPGGRVVKRVAAVSGEPVPDAVAGAAEALVPAGMLVLLGDNPAVSTDSRHYGYVEAGRVVGVVVRRMG